MTVDENRVFFANPATGNAFMLNWQLQEFTQLQDMEFTRQDPGCGLVFNASAAGPEVVVTGDGTTEIFNVASGEWREGPTPPHVAGYRYGVAQLEETFILVGGFDDVDDPEHREQDRGNDEYFLDTLWQFDQIEYEWVLRDQVIIVTHFSVTACLQSSWPFQTLVQGRKSPAVVAVGADFFSNIC